MAEWRDVSKRAIIDVNSIVSGRNFHILTSIIVQLLTDKEATGFLPNNKR